MNIYDSLEFTVTGTKIRPSNEFLSRLYPVNPPMRKGELLNLLWEVRSYRNIVPNLVSKVEPLYARLMRSPNLSVDSRFWCGMRSLAIHIINHGWVRQCEFGIPLTLSFKQEGRFITVRVSQNHLRESDPIWYDAFRVPEGLLNEGDWERSAYALYGTLRRMRGILTRDKPFYVVLDPILVELMMEQPMIGPIGPWLPTIRKYNMKPVDPRDFYGPGGTNL